MVVDKRRLLELDEQRRRAEQDKMAAIRALEKRSLEFMREKQEKNVLSQKLIRFKARCLWAVLRKILWQHQPFPCRPERTAR